MANPSSAQDAATKYYVDNKMDYRHEQVSDFHEGVQLNSLSQLQKPTTDLDMNGNQLKNLKEPVIKTDASTKNYVDTKADYRH